MLSSDNKLTIALYLEEVIKDTDDKEIEYPTLNDKIQEFYKKLLKEFGNKKQFENTEIIKVINETMNNSANLSELKIRNVLKFVLESGDMDSKDSIQVMEIVFDMRSKETIELDTNTRTFLINQCDSVLDKMKSKENQPATISSYWKVPVVYLKYLIEKGINNTPKKELLNIDYNYRSKGNPETSLQVDPNYIHVGTMRTLSQ